MNSKNYLVLFIRDTIVDPVLVDIHINSKLFMTSERTHSFHAYIKYM
jgi:hypothetical protein